MQVTAAILSANQNYPCPSNFESTKNFQNGGLKHGFRTGPRKPSFPRNKLCECGSGKKYKKCCILKPVD